MNESLSCTDCMLCIHSVQYCTTLLYIQTVQMCEGVTVLYIHIVQICECITVLYIQIVYICEDVTVLFIQSVQICEGVTVLYIHTIQIREGVTVLYIHTVQMCESITALYRWRYTHATYVCRPFFKETELANVCHLNSGMVTCENVITPKCGNL